MVMGSPHSLSQVNKVLVALDRDGYDDMPIVRKFREEICEKTKSKAGRSFSHKIGTEPIKKRCVALCV
jgi:hypothetical protein